MLPGTCLQKVPKGYPWLGITGLEIEKVVLGDRWFMAATACPRVVIEANELREVQYRGKHP